MYEKCSPFFDNLAASAPLLIKCAKLKSNERIKSILAENKKSNKTTQNKCKKNSFTFHNSAV